MWADHADSISKAYAGSGALKTDFTRTNKRTRQGLLEDGYKSVLRYLRNNYFDGARQVRKLSLAYQLDTNKISGCFRSDNWSMDSAQERIHVYVLNNG